MPKPLFRLLFALAFLGLTGCGQQRVLLVEPKDEDLVMLNGCVISACNYLAIAKARHTLESNFWAKVLLVRFKDHPAGHAYCVWETDGTIYGYDRNSGGFPIPIYTRDPRAIATVLAEGLSKIMKEPLLVQSAEFVEPATAELYAYSVSAKSTRSSNVLGTAQFRTGASSLPNSGNSKSLN